MIPNRNRERRSLNTYYANSLKDLSEGRKLSAAKTTKAFTCNATIGIACNANRAATKNFIFISNAIYNRGIFLRLRHRE